MGDVLAPAGHLLPPRLIEGPCRQSPGIPSRATMLAGKSLRHARLPAGVPAPVGKAPLRRAPNSSGREGREAPQSGVLIRDFITRWYVCRKVWKFVKAVAAAGRVEGPRRRGLRAGRGKRSRIFRGRFPARRAASRAALISLETCAGRGKRSRIFRGRFPARRAVFRAALISWETPAGRGKRSRIFRVRFPARGAIF